MIFLKLKFDLAAVLVNNNEHERRKKEEGNMLCLARKNLPPFECYYWPRLVSTASARASIMSPPRWSSIFPIMASPRRRAFAIGSSGSALFRAPLTASQDIQ